VSKLLRIWVRMNELEKFAVLVGLLLNFGSVAVVVTILVIELAR